MRKWFCAGAVASVFLLLGAAPAQADVDPASADGLLSSLGNLLQADLLGGGLLGAGLLGAGLTPDGRPASAVAPRESALFYGGVPLLGGLGGRQPANEAPRTPPATGDAAATGMPAGGTAVDPAPADPDDPDDPRQPEEEPSDDGGEQRPFSGSGRPVAGEDQDFL